MDTVTLTPAADLTYDDIVVLVDWMAEHHFTVGEIAYAVAKPWKHRDWIRRAHLGAPPADETSEDDTHTTGPSDCLLRDLYAARVTDANI